MLIRVCARMGNTTDQRPGYASRLPSGIADRVSSVAISLLLERALGIESPMGRPGPLAAWCFTSSGRRLLQ